MANEQLGSFQISGMGLEEDETGREDITAARQARMDTTQPDETDLESLSDAELDALFAQEVQGISPSEIPTPEQRGPLSVTLPDTVKSLAEGITHAETGSVKNPWIRTMDSNPVLSGGRKLYSSAYGPMQITTSLNKLYMKNHPNLFTKEELSYMERFSEQGKKMLNVSETDPTNPKYGFGGTGEEWSDRDKELYFSVAGKMLEHHLEQAGGDEEKAIAMWRGMDRSKDPHYFERVAKGKGSEITIVPGLGGSTPTGDDLTSRVAPLAEAGEIRTLDTRQKLLRAIEQDKEGAGNAVKKSLIRGTLGILKTAPDLGRMLPGVSDEDGIGQFLATISNEMAQQSEIFDIDDDDMRQLDEEGWTALFSNPAILGQMAIEQVPNIALMMTGAGAGAKAAQILKLQKLGTAIATATGSSLAVGIQEGTQAFDEATKLGISNPKAAGAKVGAAAFGLSFLMSDYVFGGGELAKSMGLEALVAKSADNVLLNVGKAGLFESLEEVPLVPIKDMIFESQDTEGVYDRTTEEIFEEMKVAGALSMMMGPAFEVASGAFTGRKKPSDLQSSKKVVNETGIEDVTNSTASKVIQANENADVNFATLQENVFGEKPKYEVDETMMEKMENFILDVNEGKNTDPNAVNQVNAFAKRGLYVDFLVREDGAINEEAVSQNVMEATLRAGVVDPSVVELAPGYGKLTQAEKDIIAASKESGIVTSDFLGKKADELYAKTIDERLKSAKELVSSIKLAGARVPADLATELETQESLKKQLEITLENPELAKSITNGIRDVASNISTATNKELTTKQSMRLFGEVSNAMIELTALNMLKEAEANGKLSIEGKKTVDELIAAHEARLTEAGVKELPQGTALTVPDMDAFAVAGKYNLTINMNEEMQQTVDRAIADQGATQIALEQIEKAYRAGDFKAAQDMTIMLKEQELKTPASTLVDNSVKDFKSVETMSDKKLTEEQTSLQTKIDETEEMVAYAGLDIAATELKNMKDKLAKVTQTLESRKTPKVDTETETAVAVAEPETEVTPETVQEKMFEWGKTSSDIVNTITKKVKELERKNLTKEEIDYLKQDKFKMPNIEDFKGVDIRTAVQQYQNALKRADIEKLTDPRFGEIMNKLDPEGELMSMMKPFESAPVSSQQKPASSPIIDEEDIRTVEAPTKRLELENRELAITDMGEPEAFVGRAKDAPEGKRRVRVDKKIEFLERYLENNPEGAAANQAKETISKLEGLFPDESKRSKQFFLENKVGSDAMKSRERAGISVKREGEFKPIVEKWIDQHGSSDITEEQLLQIDPDKKIIESSYVKQEGDVFTLTEGAKKDFGLVEKTATQLRKEKAIDEKFNELVEKAKTQKLTTAEQKQLLDLQRDADITGTEQNVSLDAVTDEDGGSLLETLEGGVEKTITAETIGDYVKGPRPKDGAFLFDVPAQDVDQVRTSLQGEKVLVQQALEDGVISSKEANNLTRAVDRVSAELESRRKFVVPGDVYNDIKSIRDFDEKTQLPLETAFTASTQNEALRDALTNRLEGLGQKDLVQKVQNIENLSPDEKASVTKSLANLKETVEFKREDNVTPDGILSGITEQAIQDITDNFDGAIDVQISDDLAPGEWGFIEQNEDGTWRMVLNRNLRDSNALVTIAHELGHAFLPTLKSVDPKLFSEIETLFDGDKSGLKEAITSKYGDMGRDRMISEWTARMMENRNVFDKDTGRINTKWLKDNPESTMTKLYNTIKRLIYKLIGKVREFAGYPAPIKTDVANRVLEAMFNHGISTEFRGDSGRQFKKETSAGDESRGLRGNRKGWSVKATVDRFMSELQNKDNIFGKTEEGVYTGTVKKDLLSKLGNWIEKFGSASIDIATNLELRGVEEGSALHEIFVKDIWNGVEKTNAFGHQMIDFIKKRLSEKGITEKDIPGTSRNDNGLVFNFSKDEPGFVRINKPVLQNQSVLVNENGQWVNSQVELSQNERVALYLHNKNADNVRHITEGGFKIEENGPLFRMTKEQLDGIQLDAKEQAIADAISEWFNDIQNSEIAQTYKDVNGEELELVEEYFPIRVLAESVTESKARDMYDDDIPIKELSKIYDGGDGKNPGITKKRKKSNSPILLEDGFTALMRSNNTASKFIGQALPLYNAELALDSAKGDLIRSGHENLEKELRSMIESTSGQRKGRHEKLVGNIIGKFAVAKLGFRIFTALKQPASLFSAIAEFKNGGMIGNTGNMFKELAKTMIGQNKDTIAEIEEQAPWLRKRFEGIISRDIGEYMSDAERRNHFTNDMSLSQASMQMITKMDQAAIVSIWQQAKVEAKGEGLAEGTPEYWGYVKNKAQDVIRKTQPIYDTNGRASITRGVLLKPLTMFYSQQSRNLMIAARGIREIAMGNFKDGVPKLFNTLVLQSAALLLLADVKDEWFKDEDKQRDSYLGDPNEWIKMTLGNIAGLRTIIGKVADGYDSSDPLSTAMNEIGDAITSLGTILESDDSREEKTRKVKNVLSPFGSFFGIPVDGSFDVLSQIEELFENTQGE